MAKRYAVVLSDIHIGNNHPTCWYQKSVHEQPLSTALTWVAQQKDKVREVLFLGDMFDTWTYPPSVRPPTMSEIIAANPNLLGPGGPLPPPWSRHCPDRSASCSATTTSR